jgi:hypothetical protein
MDMPPDHEATRERTQAWLATLDLVGTPEDELRSAADERGVQIRVITRDGKSFLVRADRRPNRVNVDVAGGRVTGVRGVY